MPNHRIRTDAHASRQRWLEALLDRRSDCELHACSYFSRRQAWSHQHHTLQQHFVVFCERGTLSIDTGARDLRAESGGLLWIPPGTPRRIHGDPARPVVRHLNLRFTLRYRGRHLIPDGMPFALLRADATRPALDELLAYREHPGPFPEARLRGLLLGLATACFAADDGAATAEGLLPQQRRRLQLYLASRLHQAIGPRDLAGELGLSLDYFTRLFRRTYRVPPRRFLVEERMRAAAERLSEGSMPVAAVGREVGVADANLFIRQFKAVMGCTPAVYRRRARPAAGPS